MRRLTFAIHLISILTVLGLAGVFLVRSASAGPALFQATVEPTIRPTALPAPYIEVSLSQGIADQPFGTVVTGYQWPTTAAVVLAFDDMGRVLAGPFGVNGDGSFSMPVTVPAGWATAGGHQIIAAAGGFTAQASIMLFPPAPTDTPAPTNTPAPTDTHTPTPTAPPTKPPTPTLTRTPTPTLTPTPTFRPITPVYTETPVPRPTGARPRATWTPVPSMTPTDTATPSATPTGTLPPTLTPAQTLTYTPSPTVTPSPTPEAELSTAVPPTATPEPATPVAGLVPVGAVTATEGAPAVPATEEGIGSQEVRLAVVGVILGGVFLAIFVTLLVLGLWIAARTLRARGILKQG